MNERLYETRVAELAVNDEAQRRRLFGWLASATLARSVGPGAVNYLSNWHVLAAPNIRVPSSHAANVTSFVAMIVLLGVVGRILSRYPAGDVIIKRGTVWLLVVLLFTFVRAAGVTGLFEWRESTDLLTLLGVVLGICALRPRLEYLRILAVLGSLVATYSVALAVAAPDHAYMIVNGSSRGFAEKAIVGGQVLAGPMSHSNSLGIFVALSAPWALLVRNPFRRCVMLTLLVGTIIATGSRTSLLAVAIALAFVSLLRSRGDRVRIAGGVCAMVLALGACVALPLLVSDPAAFTARGEVWQRSMDAWRSAGSPVFGLGQYWTGGGLRIGRADLRPTTTSGHNVFVQWLVVGGPLLVLCGGRLIFLLIRQARDAICKAPVLASYILVLLVTSATEFVWVPQVSSQLFVVTILVLAALTASDERVASAA